MNRNELLKIFDAIDMWEVVLFSKFGELTTMNEGIKNHSLCAQGIEQKIINTAPTQFDKTFYGWTNDFHVAEPRGYLLGMRLKAGKGNFLFVKIEERQKERS
jgi:hypothetical protein